MRTTLLVPSLWAGWSISTNALAAPVETLETYITDYIQIDWDCEAAGFPAGCDDLDFAATETDPGDANLSAEPDLYDGTESFDLPGGGGTYIDWEDLLTHGQHQGMDNTLVAGKDATAFPRAISCVGPARVLAKMDLTYVLAANNVDWAYFGVQRSKNNGDAAYYWVLTKAAPGDAQGSCKVGEQELRFDIAPGDVLLGGHFTGGGATVLRVFTAATTRSDVLALNAVDFTDTTLWAEESTGFVAAVNTTPTDEGGYGLVGVESRVDANTMGPQIFAEAAVDMDYFTMGGDACNATYYGTVITRSSGSGGTSPDLKDVAGPYELTFNAMVGEASLEAGCDNEVTYHADAGAVPASCDWVFDDGTVVTDSCDGTVLLTAGARTGTVTITNPDNDCSDVVTTNTVEVYDPIACVATLTGTCDEAVGYGATVTGGSGVYDYDWAFSDGSGSNTLSGTIATGPIPTGGAAWSGDLFVTDQSRIECTGYCTDDDMAYSPIAVGLSPDAIYAECPTVDAGGVADAVTYAATITGGTGDFAYDWSLDACDGAATCTLDPADGDLCVDEQVALTVRDAGLCPDVTSETETYMKVTVIEATDL